MTGLVLLVGVLWVFGGLQSGVLAQDGGKFSYPRALERLESLVATLNESLQEELQEVRLGLNLTTKILGDVQSENEVLKKNNGRLEAQLLETRSELATTKSLHQQAIDELRAAQGSSGVKALKRGLKKVRKKVSGLEDEQLSERLTAIENEQLPRQLNELKRDFGALQDEVEKVENELCEKVQNLTFMFEDAKESSEESITVSKQEIARSRSLAATQQESIDRLTTQVTRQGQRVNQLNDSVTDQGKRLDNLTSTVEEQGSCIARLKEDVIKIKNGRITDCYDAMMQGYTESGVYTIQPNNTNNTFSVYCDMDTDGGGWTVLLKRQDGSVDFQRNWADYKSSFGNLTGEHWLGLDNMYLLTHQSSAPLQLRVDLADWEGNTTFAKYDQFSVGAEDSDYTLSVSGYQNVSTAGDALTAGKYGPHNGQRFSTPDRDNDGAAAFDCVVFYHGPWWHRACYDSLLTGKYYTNGEHITSSSPHGIIWWSFRGRFYSLRVAEMKIRPGGV